MRRKELLDPNRAILAASDWPPQEQAAWQKVALRHIAPGPFRKYGGGSRCSSYTLLKSEGGMGRWLGFLQRAGRLAECECPLERLTPENLDAYFEHLVACGNANRSVVGRFEELRLAYEAMFIGRTFGWIAAPHGRSLKQLLPHRPQPQFVPDAAVSLAWASELFQAALSVTSPYYRCIQVRDALIIAILATRAPRLRALSALRVGTHLYHDGDEWILSQHGSITKRNNDITLPLSPEVGSILERYLRVERPEMLGKASSDMLWITHGGGHLDRSSLVARVRGRSLRRFGIEFGPHRFRYGLTTTLAFENPAAPLDASLILGHGKAASMESYNRATAVFASRRHQGHLKDLRQQTEELAKTAFRAHEPLRKQLARCSGGFPNLVSRVEASITASNGRKLTTSRRSTHPRGTSVATIAFWKP